MARLAKLLGLPASLLLALVASPAPVHAAQNIDVALHASFAKPPLLIELLETAAQENATSYFILLDRIAEGRFAKFSSDKEIYDAFLDELDDFEFLQTPGALSSFKLALSLHSSAPRIQAHYQFYKAAVEADEGKGVDKAPDITYWGSGTKCWDLACESTESTGKPPADDHTLKVLDFDRIYGKEFLESPRTIYADIASPDFPKVYKDFAAACYQDQVPYRLRYKPSSGKSSLPLVVNGYGVELALKRTDYIVIDDRENQGEAAEKSGSSGLSDDEATDVKSLSSSEVLDLGLKTGSFVMNSDDPFATLSRISQDFPKHASFLATQNTSEGFLKEHQDNRDILLPAGLNILWMNGMQIPPRDINAFTLLDQLRRERKFIDSLQNLGLTAEEAHKLLTHSSLAENEAASEPQRYDWRDDIEGGQAIVWLNNIEKDKRYDEWPTGVQSLLQRTYPGQLPAVRLDIHNAIFPVDLSTSEAIELILDHLQRLVKSQVPLRIGIVPNPTSGEVAGAHAKVFYHLQEAYGLSAALDYLQSIVKRSGEMPTEDLVKAAISGRKLRREQKERTFWDLMNTPAMKRRVDPPRKYLARLSADGTSPVVFGNGMLISRNDEWMSGLGQRLSLDVRTLQRMVMEEALEDGTWVPSVLLKGASTGRNPFIVPEDEKNVKLFDFTALHAKHATEMDGLYLFAPTSKLPAANKTRMMIVTDFNYDQNLIANAFEAAFSRGDVELLFLHNTQPEHATTHLTMIGKSALESLLKWENPNLKPHMEELKEYLARKLTRQQSTITRFDGSHWSLLAEELGVKEGEKGILVNGRLVGPMPAGRPFTVEDFNLLLDYENGKRIQPVRDAIHDLGLESKFNSGFELARATSIIALSQVSDVPEGIFDTSPGPRMNFFDQFNSSFTCIQRGDKSKAQVQLVASLDPSSEIAQRWIPILDVLSNLEGVYLRIFLNPRENLKELPSKRFYRYVLGREPQFDGSGSMQDLSSQFAGIPRDTLLTMTMDTPPSWLVAPKDSVHDLDNIKLSSVKGGEDVTAVYELEHILIEGHSRDLNTGNPPRGAQLVLSTPNEPDFADTIIMANLGYFQFHANPGVYNLRLKEGKSQQVFNIDSAGTKGYAAHPGDNTTEITLLSFQGSTVFPRLSRRSGQEDADVLEEAGSVAEAASDLASDAARRADAALKQAGAGFKVSDLLNSAKQLGQKVLNLAGGAPNPHAEINIFSVASGHLYERMLHIMMLSVMKHTKHTVKFWFIEQFLSPSFKQSLPHLAVEYGFKYEMITYAWPHWLRNQKEKQRLIWGYKILFLDVLFPLDLDKVIFVDADQIVRTDMYELVNTDLEGAPYGFTPMCDSRTEMEGFRFWKTGYWANFLHGRPYHISALYVVDLKRFRQLAAGDRLRQQYHALSADPGSLANLDQDLPNHMQGVIPIKSLDQDWLWCETWCSDEALKTARTIDLCNNPQTKEPKLDRAKRQVPEWTTYDSEIAEVLVQRMGNNASGRVGEGGVQEQLQEEERREKLAEEAAKPKDEAKPPVVGKEKPKHEEL